MERKKEKKEKHMFHLVFLVIDAVTVKKKMNARLIHGAENIQK